MEKHFFKVRRLLGYAGNKELEGIIVPIAYVNNYSDTINYRGNFYSLEGKSFTNVDLKILERFLDTKIVRITNKELKEKIDTFVLEAKKAFSLQKKACEEKIKFLKMTKEVEAKHKELSEMSNTFVTVQGFLSKEEFLSNFKVTTVNGYKCGWSIKGFNLTGLTLEKEVHLGKYLDEDSYDFLYREYDGHIFIDDRYFKDGESEDFKKIKSKNFRKLTDKKIGKHKVIEDFYGDVGDKNSGYITHSIRLCFDAPIEIKECNISKIKDLKNKFKDLLV